MTLNRLTLSLSRLARATITLAMAAVPLLASADVTGYVRAWGYPLSGAVPPAASSGVKSISAGNFHTVALKADGTVLAWGANNTLGQLNVPAGLTATAVAAGYGHTLAIKSDGTVVAWGDNSFGVCDIPPGLSDVVGIATKGQTAAMALKGDGTVVAWGYDGGHRQIPAGLSDVAEIACTWSNGLALKHDGTVEVWGDGEIKTGKPAGLSGVVHLATSAYNVLALKSDGTVVAWGDNSNGQSDVPSGLSDVIAIAAGEFHSLALKRDGTIVGWGYNGYGQAESPGDTSGAIDISVSSGSSFVLIGPKPFPATFSVTKPTVTGGRPGPETGILTMPSSATSDMVFTLSSSNSAATVPTSVTIPSGQSSVSFAIWSNRVPAPTPVTITASTPFHEDGTLEMTLNPFTLDRIRLTGVVGGEVECGKPYTATVYLDAPTREPVAINVACDIPWATPESPQVIVPAGSIKGTVTINTQWHNLTQHPVLTATLGDSTVSASVTVVPFPTIVSVTANKPVLYGRSTGSFTITLSRPALAGGTTVNVDYSRGGLALGGPTSVTIPQGKTTARFPVTSNGAFPFAFPAFVYVNNYMSEVGASVQLEPILVRSIALDSQSVTGGTDVTATVTLTHKVDFDTYVSLYSTSPYVFSVSSVLVRAGSRSGTTTFHTTPVRTQKAAFIVAYRFYGTDNKTKKLQITP